MTAPLEQRIAEALEGVTPAGTKSAVVEEWLVPPRSSQATSAPDE
jgi:hypothetical protein